MKKVLYILGLLDDEDIEWMIDNGNVRRVEPDEELVVEGQALDALFIILEGTLSVRIASLDNREVARLGRGEIVGEMSFVDTRPPSATVCGTEDTRVLSIPKDDLNEELEVNPYFAARFYRALSTFLSYRLRKAPNLLGFGKSGQIDLKEDQTYDDELDLNVLDTIHLAGMRFDRMVKQLL